MRLFLKTKISYLMLYSELTRATAEWIKQEDEGKFRCKTCNKLFKASTFVEKHIANKHSSLLTKELREVSVYFTFDLTCVH